MWIFCTFVCCWSAITTGNNQINFRHECSVFNGSVRTSRSSHAYTSSEFCAHPIYHSTNAQQNFHNRFLVLLLLLWFSHSKFRIRFTFRFSKPTKAERQHAKRRWNQIKKCEKNAVNISCAYVSKGEHLKGIYRERAKDVIGSPLLWRQHSIFQKKKKWTQTSRIFSWAKKISSKKVVWECFFFVCLFLFVLLNIDWSKQFKTQNLRDRSAACIYGCGEMSALLSFPKLTLTSV